MVFFYDLSSHTQCPEPSIAPVEGSTRETPNRSHPLSALLAVYPFLSGLAPYLDHNDLYNLSSTCWQFHENLVQYRKTLLGLSLRCSRSDAPIAESDQSNWRSFRGGRRCVRDLVNFCLMCNDPYCRNCINTPTSAQVRSRYRYRLCSICRNTPTFLSPSQGYCKCIDVIWFCTQCAHAIGVVNTRRISRSPITPLDAAEANRERCSMPTKKCKGGNNDIMGIHGGVSLEPDMREDNNNDVRSLCGWCFKIILSKQDELDLEQLR